MRIVTMTEGNKILRHVTVGEDVVFRDFVNIYGCTIGAHTRIGTFVEIQKDVIIGENCKIQSHTFICSGVTIGNGVFIGHGVMFTNDLYPRATNAENELQTEQNWTLVRTFVEDGASIGSGVSVRPGITIGRNAMVGVGSVVVHDVPPNAVVAGNPARIIRKFDQTKE